MPSVHDQVSEQFYRWEVRGRGWQAYSEPVAIEPPFVPFQGYYFSRPPVVDDGRRPTLLSSLFGKLAGKHELPPMMDEPEEEPEPSLGFRESLVELQTSLPADLNIPKETFEQFLTNLSLSQEPISFELIGTHQKVSAQFAAHASDVSLLRRQLEAFFPEAGFRPHEGGLEQALESSEGEHTLAVEFGLEREFMFPLASGKLDPFIGIVGGLSDLQPAELGVFQVLFQSVHNQWADSITRSVTHADGKPFFVNMPGIADAAKNKVARPLYAAVVRIFVKTKEYGRTLNIARDLAGSLRVFIHPQGNALVPLDNDDYPPDEHVEDVLRRQSRRPGMLLNSDELIGFVHLPSSAIRSPVLQRQTEKTRPAPSTVRQRIGNALGNNVHAGESTLVRLTPEQRVRHTHIIGASGTGKSTLLFNLIKQDIENGQGIAVLDPHGDLIDRICGIIPQERIADVVLVDPSDELYSVGFNILSAHSDLEKNLLASDLVSVFQRLSTSWGDQMNSVLQNAILAFLESNRGGTIVDLQRFLTEPAFRNEFLKTVQDSQVVYYWQKSFPLLSGNKSIGSILTRLDTFLNKKPIRHMVSQSKNRLDFAQITDTSKIFLARLSEGLLGQENSYLLGTLLVSKFQQLAMSRQAQRIAFRKDFWIYIDEFANFITPSMAAILSGARKYRIGLTLAHQELHQLQRDSDVASAVMSHPFTRIVFRVSDDDAKRLADGFSHFEAQDLKNLETFQAIARVERSDYDFNLSVHPPQEIDQTEAEERRQEVITASREKYGMLRAQVEARERLNWEAEPWGEGADLKAPSARANVSTSPPAPATPASSDDPKSAEIPKPPARTEPASPPDTSATERQHDIIKKSIRTEAESLDYTVFEEKPFPAIHARADILLERGKQTIVAQICATNGEEYEAESVRKFLKASFSHIALISVSRKKLNLIKQILTDSREELAGVGFYSPEEFISELFDWATDDPDGGKMERAKLRKRPLNLISGPLTEAERRQNEKMMLEDLKQRLKR